MEWKKKRERGSFGRSHPRNSMRCNCKKAVQPPEWRCQLCQKCHCVTSVSFLTLPCHLSPFHTTTSIKIKGCPYAYPIHANLSPLPLPLDSLLFLQKKKEFKILYSIEPMEKGPFLHLIKGLRVALLKDFSFFVHFTSF